MKEDWLVFVPPAGVLLIFVLSFFTWHLPLAGADRFTDGPPALSLWGLSFTANGQAQFLAYTILMFPTGLVAVVALLFAKGFAPPQLAPVATFKYLVVSLLLAATFLMLCIDYFGAHFNAAGNPIAIPLKLAFRVHFVALLTSFVLFWLDLRKRSNLPPPTLEARW